MEILLVMVVVVFFFLRKDTRKIKKRITMNSCELISRAPRHSNKPLYKVKLNPEDCKIELRFDNGMKVISRGDGRELHSFYQKGAIASIIEFYETEIYLFEWKIKTFRDLKSLQISYKKLNLDKYKVSNF